MNKLSATLFLGIALGTATAQTLSLKFGTPFRRPDLDVRWTVPTNALPSQVWLYHLLPNRFSPTVISNLTTICSFTDHQLTRDDTNWLVFQARQNSRRLGIFFPLGSIEYETREKYSPTNLIFGVPTEAEVFDLTTNVLAGLGINISEIERKQDGQAPDFALFADTVYFFVNRSPVTNLVWRGVRFRRSIDGARFVGAGTGGNGEIRFGDHCKVSYISLSWRNLERFKAYPTASPRRIIDWIRHGKAVQGMLPMGTEPINWKTVKSMTIVSAKLCYYAGGPFDPSDWLVPFVALWTTVDTGHGTIDVEIDCPIMDQTSPQTSKAPP